MSSSQKEEPFPSNEWETRLTYLSKDDLTDMLSRFAVDNREMQQYIATATPKEDQPLYDAPVSLVQAPFQSIYSGSSDTSSSGASKINSPAASRPTLASTYGRPTWVRSEQSFVVTTETSSASTSARSSSSKKTGGSSSSSSSSGYVKDGNKLFATDLVCSFNDEFQSVLGSISDEEILKDEESFAKLTTLARDFESAALQYGKVIISEKYLPSHLKTIKPKKLGGIAGGEKYIKAGILFKFSIDSKNIYGSDEFAAKEAGHQLKSAISLFTTQNTENDAIRFPLLMLIDYLGYRLLAISLLPIDKKSLLYGSNDAGKTIKNDERVSRLMETTAQILNLKGHYVGKKDGMKLLHMPCDIEIHQGHDGHLYGIDVARLFPPEPPSSSSSSFTSKADHLIKLLRPELVRKAPTPLSSDAFTRFGIHDYKVHNNEVSKAFEMLTNTVIPNFAKWLDSRSGEVSDDHVQLISRMHEQGINVRHAGRVRSLLTDSSRREQLLIELAARCIKADLRSRMRRIMESVRLASLEPFRVVVLNVLNLVFGFRPEAFEYRYKFLISELQKRFTNCLSTIELQKAVEIESIMEKRSSSKVLGDSIGYFPFSSLRSMIHLFRRVQVLCGIRISEDGERDVVADFGALFRRPFPFESSDVLNPIERVKQMPVLQYAQGTWLLIRARNKNTAEAQRLAKLAIRNFQQALAFNSSDYTTLCTYAFLMEDVVQDYKSAETLYRRALHSNPKHLRSLYYFALFLIRRMGDAASAKHYFEEAIRVNPTHVNALKDYGNLLGFHLKEHDKAEMYFKRALAEASSNTKALLGFAHYMFRIRKDYEKSLKYFVLAFRSNPDELDSITDLIIFLRETRPASFPAKMTILRHPKMDSEKYPLLSMLVLLAQKAAKVIERYLSSQLNGGYICSDRGSLAYTRLLNTAAGELVGVAIEAEAAGYAKIASGLFQYIVNDNLPSTLILFAEYCLDTKKDVEKAKSLLKRLVEANPSPEHYIRFADFLHKYTRNSENSAGTYYRKAIEADPQNETNQLSYLSFINKTYADDTEKRRASRREALDWISSL